VIQTLGVNRTLLLLTQPCTRCGAVKLTSAFKLCNSEQVSKVVRQKAASLSIENAPSQGGLDQTWNWVIGSPGQLSRAGHRVIILTQCETRVFPVFKKKPKIKIYIFVKIRPIVIEILTLNK